MTTKQLSQAIKAGAVSANDYGLDANGVIEVEPIEAQRYDWRVQRRKADER